MKISRRSDSIYLSPLTNVWPSLVKRSLKHYTWCYEIFRLFYENPALSKMPTPTWPDLFTIFTASWMAVGTPAHSKTTSIPAPPLRPIISCRTSTSLGSRTRSAPSLWASPFRYRIPPSISTFCMGISFFLRAAKPSARAFRPWAQCRRAQAEGLRYIKSRSYFITWLLSDESLTRLAAFRKSDIISIISSR